MNSYINTCNNFTKSKSYKLIELAKNETSSNKHEHMYTDVPKVMG